MKPSPLLNKVLKKRYLIRQLLGEGRFAQTFLAEDQKSKQACAIKILRMRDVAELKHIDLFRREAKVLANLDHPNIPRYIDFFVLKTHMGTLYCLVQQHIQGQSLAQHLAQGRRFQYQEIRQIAFAVCGLLGYLHGLSPPVLHRDIKPSNIILDEAGQVYLVDFGSARDRLLYQSYRDTGQGSTIVGTYGYMPYEQFSGKASPASDIYALGATLALLYSGKDPADLLDKHMQLNLRKHLQLTSKPQQVLAKMLAFEPKHRYQNVQELKSALRVLPTRKGFAWVFSTTPSKPVLIAEWIFIIALVAAVVGWIQLQPDNLSERVAYKAPQIHYEASTLPTDLRLLQAAQTAREEPTSAQTVSLMRLLDEYRYLETQLQGHTEAINALALKRDMNNPLLASAGRRLKLWQLKNKQLLAEQNQFGGKILALAFNEKNGLLATGGENQAIQFWKMDDLSPQGLALPSSATVRELAFTPNGELLVAVLADSTLQLWRMDNYLPVSQPIKTPSQINSLLISDNGQLLIFGDQRGDIHFWRLQDLRPEGEPIHAHQGAVLSLALVQARQGAELASGGTDGLVRLWNPVTRQPVRKPLRQHQAPVTALAYGGTFKRQLTTTDTEGALILWNLFKTHNDDKLFHQRLSNAQGAALNALSVDLESERLITAGESTTVGLWQLRSDWEPVNNSAILLDERINANSLAFSADSQLLAVNDGEDIEIYDLNSAKRVHYLAGLHNKNIYGLAFHPNGQQLVSTAENGRVIIADIHGEQASQTLEGLSSNNNGILSVAFSPDGNLLASGAGASFFDWSRSDNRIRVWDMNKGQLRYSINAHSDSLWRVVFSPDGKTLASTGQDGQIKLWSAANGDLKKSWSEQDFSWQKYIEGHALGEYYTYTAVKDLAYSPDGKQLVSIGRSQMLKFWDAESGELRAEAAVGHSTDIMRLAFSPDGKWLALTGKRHISLWDAQTQERLAILHQGQTDSDNIRTVAISPDGQWLAVAGEYVLLWRLDAGFWADAACRMAGRNMSTAEWQAYAADAPYQKTCQE